MSNDLSADIPVYKRLYDKSKHRFSTADLSIDADIDKLRREYADKWQSEFYFNENTGPGAYDLPPLFGTISVITDKKNSPAYSIGTQSRDKLLIITRSQAESAKGQSSPGVCKYDTETLKLKSKAPVVTIGREKRFSILSEDKIIEKTRPHFYDTIDRFSIKEAGNKTNEFPKYQRFGERNK